MLDETLVLVLSEHSRTPRLQNVRGGGRDHRSQACSALFVSGGIALGWVVGRTDRPLSLVPGGAVVTDVLA